MANTSNTSPITTVQSVNGNSTFQNSKLKRNSKKVNVWILLQALKRRWFQAGVVAILLAVLAATILWFVVPYTQPSVYARIRILDRVGGSWQEHPDPPLQRQTQVALIKNPVFMSSVLKNSDVAKLSVIKEQPDPEDWLMKELKVEFPFGPEVMQFSMSGDKPHELKILVNNIREVYLRDFGSETKKERMDRLTRLTRFDDMAKTEIDVLREKMRKNADAGKDVNTETVLLRQKLTLELQEATKKEIIRAESELRHYRNDLKIFSDNKQQALDTSSKYFDEVLNNHPQLMPLKQQQANLQELLDRTIKAAPTNIRVKQLQDELVSIQKQIDEKKTQLRPSLVTEIQSKTQAERTAILDNIKFKIKQLEEALKTLRADLAEYVKVSMELNTNSVNVEEDKQKIGTLESIRAKLSATVENLKAELDTPERIRKMGDPMISTADRYSNKIRFSILGSVIAFGLGLLLIAFLESRTHRVSSPDEIEDHFGMNVVGMVPAPPKRLSLGFKPKEDDEEVWQTILTESVDSFRTQLIHTAKKNSLQIIMVCSADSGEGKTSLACHLALSLARSGQKTLLVDADLRNPTAHELFEMPLEPGLSELIRELVPVQDSLHRTTSPGLWLLPAGKCNTRVIELLAQEVMTNIFSELRAEFDFIIVDTSPILPVADPLLVAQHADGVIFSMMHQVSRISSVREAIDKLNALNIHTLGAVMNGTQAYRGYSQRKYAYRNLNN
ncbi:MAG: polysaccharide biosynthesis tyrosine autokinase [Planctomycetia bacterium]|nr:polysaccharide biosynthesis tyrosine autokinase [Planctomycetia bacterium]